jgi:uncharacterized protein (TIGR02118 family)
MKKGMIKLSVMYPHGEGKFFNMDFYSYQHAKLVTSSLGDALKGFSVEAGLGGMAPGSTAPYVAIATMYFDSLESFQQSFAASADKLMADIPNFTDITPIAQISQVVF